MNDSPVNVAEYLQRLAATHPRHPAIHVPIGTVRWSGVTPHRTITFAELHQNTDALAHGLQTIGIQRGTRTALMVPPSAEFIELTFALLKVGAIPVMIDPGMGLKNLGHCLEQAEPEAFIGVPLAHVARRLYGWAKRTLRVTVNVGAWRLFCSASSRRLRDNGLSLGTFSRPSFTPDDPAAILFTSGSTGIAKGVLYTHGIFSAQVRLLKQVYAIEPGEVDLCTFPLFALFGPALGMTCVIPQMNASKPATVDPRKLVAQAQQFHITNLFGSPAVIRRLAEGGLKLPSSLRRVISAGAPARPDVLAEFTKLLPEQAVIFTPYGATESLPIANVSSSTILQETRFKTEQGHGVCVGYPVPGVTVQVMPISDEPVARWSSDKALSSGEIGEFIVKGPVVTKEYFRKPEANRMAKMHDADTGEVWHRTGDVGYLDELGRLWFCGRKSHRVVLADRTLFTDCVEPIFNTVKGVSRTALVSVRQGGSTLAVLCVELQPRSAWSDVLQELKQLAGQHQLAIDEFLLYDRTRGFPVDVRHNSKIFREQLAIWADKQLKSNWKGHPS